VGWRVRRVLVRRWHTSTGPREGWRILEMPQACAISEHAAIAHYYLGRLFTNTEKYDEAEKEFKAALAIDSKQMNEAHRMLANLFIVNGDAPRAVEELEIYLKLMPRAPDADNLRKVMNQLKSSMTPPPNTKPL